LKDSDREISQFMLNATASPRSLWILTDGKAGDVAQCVGVADTLNLPHEMRTVSPKPPYSWWMPFGPFPPADREDQPGSPLAPPFPDIAVASGRRAAAYLRRLKKASNGKTFTVFLKDPRSGAKMLLISFGFPSTIRCAATMSWSHRPLPTSFLQRVLLS
jgi:hypothetical protein